MYPVKLYNSNNVLIYQVDNGGDNTNMLPSGGVLVSSTVASSMSEAIVNPVTFYGSWGSFINQSGQSSDLYNYYWSSYSRGTDGTAPDPNNPLWHNDYLDSYIPSRHKSIYDPCPYGYRIPSNGTYNEFTTNAGWTQNSYVGGANFGVSWFVALGRRSYALVEFGRELEYFTSTISDANRFYAVYVTSPGFIRSNAFVWGKSSAMSIRCIEDCSVVSDATEASAGY